MTILTRKLWHTPQTQWLLKARHTVLKSIHFFFFLFSFDGGSTPSSNTGGGSNSPSGSGGPGSGGGGGKSTKGTKRTKDIKLIIDIYNLSDFFSAIFLLILLNDTLKNIS